MKAIIMAAGKGVRMMPLTADKPKVMVEVNGRPFLYYVIERMKKAGFSDFGIVVGYRKESIMKHFTGVKFIEQREQLGTGHAVKCCRDFVGLDDFVVVNGDNLYSVKDYKSLNKDDGFCYAGAMIKENPELYGVILQENGFLRKIIEKPKEYAGNLVNVGVYKFTSDVFDALDKISLSPRGEYEITDALTLLGQENKVRVLSMTEMVDFGKPSDVDKAGLYLSKE